MSTFATLTACLYGMSLLHTILGAQKVAADNMLELFTAQLSISKAEKNDSFPYLQG